MAQHTPGPWKATCRSTHYRGGDWPESEFLQWDVEGPRGFYGRGEYLQGDAYLVAAAPDLLAACEAAIIALVHAARAGGIEPDDLFTVRELRAAVAKARGETSAKAPPPLNG